jgi:hypothetical protein
VIQFSILSQEREIVENGIVIKRFARKRVTGQLLSESKDSMSLRLYKGKYIQIPKKDVLKIVGPEMICLYNNGRFHYKNTFLYNYSFGTRYESFMLDFAFSYRIQSKIEFGIGTGVYTNSFQVYTIDNFYDVTINSRHFYALGKYYFFNKTPVRMYAKSKLGIAKNRVLSQQTSVVKIGYSLEGSIGVLLPAKRRIRHYFELGQHISNTSGVTEITGLDTKIDFDVVFYRLVFTYGIELGRKMDRVNKLRTFLFKF